MSRLALSKIKTNGRRRLFSSRSVSRMLSANKKQSSEHKRGKSCSYSLSAGAGPPSLDQHHFKVIDAFSLDSCVTLVREKRMRASSSSYRLLETCFPLPPSFLPSHHHHHSPFLRNLNGISQSQVDTMSASLVQCSTTTSASICFTTADFIRK